MSGCGATSCGGKLNIPRTSVEDNTQFSEREVHDLLAVAKWLETNGRDYERYLVEKALGLLCENYEEVYEKMSMIPEETEVG